ncbi:hypothetical protein TrVE_jg9216 [Triparma verrucosa]|uniref:DUF4461 domain-containing protein n=1 Tax=Triparma verrucosa TaxID=1606542 RepID=A0A9W7CMJ1_9STRA|nr:hypothetical protein TrVE_jg9216 [Triparma verrucosa]
MLIAHPDLVPAAHAELNTSFVQRLMTRLSSEDVKDYKKNGRVVPLPTATSSSSSTSTRVFVPSKSAIQSVDLDVPILKLFSNLQRLATSSKNNQQSPSPPLQIPDPPPPNSVRSNEEILKQFSDGHMNRYHKAPPSTHSLSIFLKNNALDQILLAKLWTRRAREQAREFTRLSGCRSLNTQTLNWSSQNTSILLRRLNQTVSEYGHTPNFLTYFSSLHFTYEATRVCSLEGKLYLNPSDNGETWERAMLEVANPKVKENIDRFSEEVSQRKSHLLSEYNISFVKGVTATPSEYLRFLARMTDTPPTSPSSSALIQSHLRCVVEGEHWRRQFIKFNGELQTCAANAKEPVEGFLFRSVEEARQKSVDHSSLKSLVNLQSRALKKTLNLTKIPEIRGEGEGWFDEVLNSLSRLNEFENGEENRYRIVEGRIDIVLGRERSFKLDNIGRIVFPRQWDE